MMFLDCPAYLDEEGTLRCGLPAEVRCRFTMRSTDGPLEAAMIRCPSGHWFNGPIEALTWELEQEHEAGTAAVGSPPPRPQPWPVQTPGSTRPGRGDGTAGPHPPGQPAQEASRPNTAPAYYLGRPAWLWLSATRPRRRPAPLAAAQTQAGGGTEPANPAGNTQLEPPRATPQAATALR
jgi:hypothetical protein